MIGRSVILGLALIVGARAAEPHWAFGPVARPEVPPSSLAPIDAFLRKALAEKGLEPAPRADRRTQIRRLFFDMHGLPPTPEQVAEFMAAGDENRAFDRLVDEVLASPRYGERWAQFWLDLVRYADTHGFEVNTERPNAWPYRDYVIRALNEDKPYDEFIVDQLAGDATGEDAATGFLVAAPVLLPGQIGKDDASKRLARQDSLDEIVVGTNDTFLALSVGCARCHDHMFDPVSQRDYYAMQAFFAGVEYGERPLHDPELERERSAIDTELASWRKRLDRLEPRIPSEAKRAPVVADRNVEHFAPVEAKFVRFTIHSTINDNRYEPCIDELEIFDTEGTNVARIGTATSSGDRPGDPQHQLGHINDGSYGNARSWISNEVGKGWVEIELAEPATIDLVVWGRDREKQFMDRLADNYAIEVATERGRWIQVASSADRAPYGAEFEPPAVPDELAKLRARRAELGERGKVYAGNFREPDMTHVLSRGDPEQPGERVAPAVLSALGGTPLDPDADEQARRLALANWIASADNPLTARVMVNRIWLGHFGRGLVNTPSDFGLNGERPSHPELLDWLAAEFVAGGWSIKKLHRQILLSEAYRQSSRRAPIAQAIDGDNRYLWHFPSRRLEAEAIRDSILAVSGELNLKTGGPGFNFFSSRGGLNGFPVVESFQKQGLRRMIYAHKVRMERAPVFGAFDCPDAGQAMPRRARSTTAIQALNLFNSQFVIDQSVRLSGRVKWEMGAGAEMERFIDRIYQRALAREPSERERAECVRAAREHGLRTVARVIFNSNEFLFLP